MERKKAYFIAATGLVVLASAVGGGLLARSFGLEEQVQALCERYALEQKVRITLQTDDGQRTTPLDVPALFSRFENFKPEEVADDYLATKQGFKYEVNSLTASPDVPSRFNGSHASYKAETELGDPFLALYLRNYEDTTESLGSSIIIIREEKGRISSITIEDRVNNTTIALQRRTNGEIEFRGIDEAGARKLFDLYSSTYYDFKRKHNIDEKLAAYSPRMELRHQMP